MGDTPSQMRERSSKPRPYLVVSADSHAGPSLEHDLRPYCVEKYRADFDQYLAETKTVTAPQAGESPILSPEQDALRQRIGFRTLVDRSDLRREADRRTRTCPGQNDPRARARDMDADGIAADVILAGGQNGELLPFLGLGHGSGPAEVSYELRAVGIHIWNLWLSDFVSVDPCRHVGVMQIPIFDVDQAVGEITWAREAGLKAVNLPAPRIDFAAYNDPIYEPLWSVCEELSLPLVTHTAGGDRPLGVNGPGGTGLHLAESHWFARRGLWQLIFGGVFEHHPRLKVVFTELRPEWVPSTLKFLDSIYLDDMLTDIRERMSKPPSEYWAANCYESGSFLAPHEVALRYEVGITNLLWGSDYPHAEGTWPRTRLAMRNTFAGIPEPDVRRILGENALGAYNLDEAALRTVADRIGPTPDELDRPLAPEEFPEFRGHAFRTNGAFS